MYSLILSEGAAFLGWPLPQRSVSSTLFLSLEQSSFSVLEGVGRDDMIFYSIKWK